MSDVSVRESVMKASAFKFKIELHKLNYFKDILGLLVKRTLGLGIPIIALISGSLLTLFLIFGEEITYGTFRSVLFLGMTLAIPFVVFPLLAASAIENKKRFSKTRYGKELISQIEKYEQWLKAYGIVPTTSLVPVSGWDSIARLATGRNWMSETTFQDVDGNNFVVENVDGHFITYYVATKEILKGDSYVSINVKTPVREGFKVPSIDPYGVRVSLATSLDNLAHKVLNQNNELSISILNVNDLVIELEGSELNDEQKGSLTWVTGEAEELSIMVLKALKGKDVSSLDSEFLLLTTEGFERLAFILRNIQNEIVREAQTGVQDWLTRVTI